MIIAISIYANPPYRSDENNANINKATSKMEIVCSMSLSK